MPMGSVFNFFKMSSLFMAIPSIFRCSSHKFNFIYCSYVFLFRFVMQDLLYYKRIAKATALKCLYSYVSGVRRLIYSMSVRSVALKGYKCYDCSIFPLYTTVLPKGTWMCLHVWFYCLALFYFPWVLVRKSRCFPFFSPNFIQNFLVNLFELWADIWIFI